MNIRCYNVAVHLAGAISGSENPVWSQTFRFPVAHLASEDRFVIYVYSKGIIADAEYVIIGSANINQRRRHDFPVLCNRPLDRMELPSLGPYFLT
ncbi:hypothetical protein ACS0TY_036761 [Phlomoides rotata]